MDGFINNIIRTLTAMPPTNNTDDIPLPTPHDEPMDTDHIHHDADGVPELQPMADSSDDGVDHNSDEEEDEEEEVVMQTVNDDGGEDIPPLEPIQSNRNRRPRVEDDEDSERDRRHPSQRINQPLDVTTAAAQDQDPNPPFLNGPTNAGLAIPIFPRLPDAAPQGQANQNQPNQNQNQQQQRQPLVNGFAITVDINGQRVVRPLPGGFTLDPANGAAGAGFADFLTFLSALSEHETDDPERAKRLVDALEEVPVGLVRRLEALSGKTSSGDGQGMGAGDCSCAICWDTLLDGEGGFGVEGEGNNHQEQSMEGLEGQQQSEALEEQQQPQSTDEQDASTSTPSSSTAPPHAQDPASPPTQDPAPSPTQDPAPPPAQDPAPPPPTSSNLVSSTDPTQPKIVSLPCAHVFHAACLIPWFSRPRQTTCPTCRFNIDPERLTARRQSPVYSFEARRSGARGQGQAQGGEQQQQEDGAAGTVPVGDGQARPRHRITAKNEVILSGGAIGTPHILQNSGIGDSSRLSKVGVEPLVHLPSVGQNLTDHPFVANTWLVNSTDTFETALRNVTLMEEQIRQWNETHMGPYSAGTFNIAGWLRLPDNSTIFKKFQDPSAGPHGAHYEFIIAVCIPCHLTSVR
ncbi:Choline dehydrogenase [Termitomyces sp. J132]|nr:Choline dehydrogenase [Termitomyces sp. J132]